ncbi:hypothetical protein DEO23_07965 [Brachybacterium endophyticum]|uniref:Uncharacterized protein n=1 Tax=Brachybacterium endophyticum TaxID=2182385 RepID=A0A2U2RM16_9MICO|nr:hypothetical protein DEO23_07965 [Brachybacterium endophyticum]
MLGARYPVLGLGARSSVPGARSVLGARCSVLGARPSLLGARACLAALSILIVRARSPRRQRAASVPSNCGRDGA